MTTPGATGHVTGHNTLETSIQEQATRFGVPVTLTGPFAIGDPNHIGVHNLERDAIAAIAAAGGITVTLPDAAALGDTGHTSDHDLMTAAVAALAAAPAWNDATGGTITTYSGGGRTMRVHTFTAGGTFTVTRAIRGFDVLVVGSGQTQNPANPNNSAGGGGQVVTLTNWDLSAQPYAVTIGATGYPAQACTLASFASAAGGGTPGAGQPNPGPGGGDATGASLTSKAGIVSTISGVSVEYGKGGSWLPDGLPTAPGDGQGANDTGHAPGAVIIAYQIGV